MALICIPFWCAAFEPYMPERGDPMLEPWCWRKMDSLKGMGILCMDQAPDGKIWFGGVDCLATYDGNEVERIPLGVEIKRLISSRFDRPWTSAILVLDNERVLGVMGRSLVLRSGNTWDVVIQDVGDPRYNTCLAAAENGSIWLMVRDRVWCLSEDLSDIKEVAKSSSKSFFSAMCIGDSDVWLSQMISPDQAYLIQIPLSQQSLNLNSQRSSYKVPVKHFGEESALAVGPHGRVWYADSYGRKPLYAFNPKEQKWDVPLGENLTPHIFSMTTTRDGVIWAGGVGTFCVIRRQGSYAYSRKELELLPSVPVKLYDMQQGQYWIIGRTGHVYVLDTRFQQWRTYLGLHYQGETPDGVEWFLSEDGRVVSHDWSLNRWRSYGVEDRIVDQPSTVTCSSHGLVWVAGEVEGRAAISIFSQNRWYTYKHPNFAVKMGRWPVTETIESTLLFGAGGKGLVGKGNFGGLLEYGVTDLGDPEFIKHHPFPAIPYYAGRVAQSKDGTLWLGTKTVFRWQVGDSQAVPIAALPSTSTLDLMSDDDDAVWVSKEGAGLYRKEKGGRNWEMQNAEQVGNYVTQLLKLNDGTLLAGSENGISRFDGAVWTEQVIDESFSMVKDGGQLLQASDGALWLNFRSGNFGSPQVVGNTNYEYYTVRYMPENDPPETDIVRCPDRIFSPGNMYISWSGFDLNGQTPSDRLQFSWRFSGGEWSPFSYASGKSFLAMASGNYQFEVRARDNDLNVDPTPSICLFRVVPPVWRQGWFLVLVSSFLILIICLCWMLLRIREKHLLENQAERERHLVEIDQIKTSFFTNISHELDTPISLMTEPLRLVLESDIAELTKERVSMALRNANRVSSLVSQLLDLRKLEQHKMQLNAVEGDLLQVLRESIELLQPLAQRHQVDLQFSGVDELRGWFDPEKLQKIVQNLVTNAIKYTPTGGVVCVHVRDSAGKLYLTVEDSGIGISEEHMKHIFDRFYRVPDESIVNGSGIGLNLAKELVDLWGGEINVESPIHDGEQRPGSRFTVMLPIVGEEFYMRRTL